MNFMIYFFVIMILIKYYTKYLREMSEKEYIDEFLSSINHNYQKI